MAKFDLSIDTILKHEDGYVNGPSVQEMTWW